MANSTIPNLVAVSVPALTDLFGVRQSGDTRDKKLTAAQLLSLGLTANGTPLNLEVAFWLDADTINHDANLTWNTLNLQIGAAGGKFRGSNSASGAIENSAASSSNPTLIPRVDDPATGIGAGATRNVNIICDGDPASTWQHTTAANNEIRWFNRLSTGISASVTQSQGNGLLNGGAFNRIDTVANVDDVVTLPAASSGGQWMTLVNRGANRLQIFPTLGDAILPNAVNVSITLDVNKSITFMLLDTTNWIALAEPAAGGAVPDPLLLGDGSAGAPTYSFSASSTTGIYSSAANRIAFSAGGIAQFLIRSGNFDSLAGNSPLMRNVTVSATIPGFCPTGADPTTGLGAHASTNFSLIASGVELIRGVNTAGVDQVIISPGVIVDDAVTPVLAFGDGSTGFYENSSGVISVATSGVRRWFFSAGSFGNVSGSGPALQNEVPSAINPTINADSGDSDTGIGHNADDQISLIGGGVEIARAQEVVGANQFIIAPGVFQNNAVAPSLAFGDGDTGFYELSDDNLKVTLAGVDRWTFTGDSFVAVTGNGPRLMNEASTGTNPTLIPALGDPSTGIGGVTTNLSLIVGGVERLKFFAAISNGASFAGDLQSLNGTGWNLIDEAASSTNPTLCPRRGDEDTGIGSNAADQLSLVAGGAEGARVTEGVGVNQFAIKASGASTVPELTSLADPDTGWQWPADNRVVMIGGGTRAWFMGTARIESAFSNGASIINAAASPGQSVFIPDKSDTDTGIGTDSGDGLQLISGGVVGLALNELNAGVIQVPDAEVAITAFATGGQVSATQLNQSNNVIGTVATTGDSVKLPLVFAVNSVIFVKNDGVNAADVFPGVGDDLGAGTDTAVSLAAGESASFIATVANLTWTPWIVSVGGGGGGDVTKVGTPVNNQVGIWTGDGTLEGDADLTFDGTILTTGATGRIRSGFGSFTTPAFSFGSETNTGIYRQAAGSLGISLSGSGNYLFQAGSFFANIVGGPQMMVEASSATNPVFIPRLSDTDTGIGSGAADQMDLIAGALSCMAVRETGGARQIGFYTTAPISLQTGVAVTAGAIHAALVALGLITA